MGGETKQYNMKLLQPGLEPRTPHMPYEFSVYFAIGLHLGHVLFVSPVTFDGQYGSVLGSRAAKGLSRRLWQGSEMVQGRFGYESN